LRDEVHELTVLELSGLRGTRQSVQAKK